MKRVYYVGMMVRLTLLFYGHYIQDRQKVKYTDVDYHVINEAAKYVAQGHSPYRRHTYRYSPILAYLMLFNQWFDNVLIGKLVFILFDILVGLLIHLLMECRKQSQFSNHFVNDPTIIVSIWLFNPFVFTISSRGSYEPLVQLLILLTIYCEHIKKYFWMSVSISLAIHLKIYAIIFLLPLYLKVDGNRLRFTMHLTSNRLKLILIFIMITTILNCSFYYLYGDEFIEQTIYYHIFRKDNRHNFSIYFYQIYLNYSNNTLLQSLIVFTFQTILIFSMAFRFRNDLEFCFFIQTFLFVTFNKVITAQYFTWFFSLFPLVLQQNRLLKQKRNWIKLIKIMTLWIFCELYQLSHCYNLEILGRNSFLQTYLSCVLFFINNLYFIKTIIDDYMYF